MPAPPPGAAGARRSRRRPGRPPWLLSVPAVVTALIAALPIAYLLVRVGEAGLPRIVEIVWRERTLTLVVRSLVLAGAVTVCSLVIGIALALLVVRSDLPGRRLLAGVAALPLAIPSYVAAFAWISSWPAMAGLPGAVIVLTLCCYPYVYLPVAAALRRADPAVEEMARSLGASPARTFRAVTVPTLAPAAAGGALLVALYALSDFGAVSILRYDAFTRVIHTSYQASFDRLPAAVLGLLLVAITLVISLGEARVRRHDGSRVGAGVARRPQLVAVRGPLRAITLGAVGLILALALAFPVASLGYWFATGLSAGIDAGRLATSTAATAWLATLGAVACLAGAVPVGILAARHRGPLAKVVDQVTYAGHALPGLVVALALVFFGVRVVPWTYQQTPLLVLAYVVLFLPIAIGAVRSAVALSSVRAEEVARSLGCSSAAVLRRVTVPLAAPGIAAGTALVLLTCMKELPATLLLRPTGTETLATGLWSHTGVGEYAAAAPYGIALVLLAVLPTAAVMRAYAGDARGRPTADGPGSDR